METEKALVFIISRMEDNMHNSYKTLWEVTVEQAKKICSDPRTKGQSHFLAWNREKDADLSHYTFIDDDGRYDDVLEEMGIK